MVRLRLTHGTNKMFCMKKIITTVFVAWTWLESFAQKCVSRGKIEFERKVNLHRLYDYEGTYGDYVRKTAPQYLPSYFDLVFLADKSVYEPGREVTDLKANNWKNFPGSE